ncbi:MAG: hypothetical protein Q4D85_05395 [Corynebacterium sp.]|uniref:hypothetical protein n=1 Tax=Corynebacterium sp. TaxID=1720 RepID=UPI0026DDC1B1|nr:hypothetical protein [Corynebacterium sp.]MDO5098177.1 hypothetical protein [Corynebacterium sp.]
MPQPLVHFYSAEEIKRELRILEQQAKSQKTTISELQERALEWDLSRQERDLLNKYERFAEMLEFVEA